MGFIDKLIKAVFTPFLKLFHKELTEKQWESLLQFIKFCIVGVTNTAISYCLNALTLILLAPTPLSQQASIGSFVFSPDVEIGIAVSFILSVLWSFYWNNKMVFTLKDGQKRNWFTALLKTYASYAFTGIILAAVLSWLWVDVLGINKFIAPLLNLVISIPVNFLMNKLWAFKSKSDDPGKAKKEDNYNEDLNLEAALSRTPVEGEPFISVTFTCYNYARYARRSLDAIRRQRFKDYEVIMCDDCSSDNTVEVIREYMAEHPEMDIKLLVNEHNMGVFETRNRLLDAAKGRYIMLCDSDDWMDDNCLEILAGAALKNDADRVIAQFRDVNEEGKTIQYQDLPEHPNKWICGVHHGTMYRRSIFIDHNIRFKEVYPDDVYINVLYNQYVHTVEYVHKTIYNWFVHTDSQSRTQKKNSPWQGVRLFESTCSFLIPVLDKLKSDVDPEAVDLELMLIKLYTLSFYCAYGRPFADFLREYDKIRAIMMKHDPDYKKNPYLKLSVDSPMRDYATKIVRMTVILEKLHLIKPALIGYKIVSKFHYFDL